VRAAIDTGRHRVIVFTNLRELHEIGRTSLTYWRGRDWTGGVVCAIVLLLAGSGLPGSGVVWAAAEAGEEGGLINLDKSLIVQVVNFLILLVILHRLLYKPLLAKMQERAAAIRTALEEARAARAETARQQEENEARLRAVQAEATAIRARALQEAAEEQKRIAVASACTARRRASSSDRKSTRL